MSRSTLDTALSLLPSLTGLSPFAAGLSSTVLLGSWISHAVRTPVCTHTGLGSFHFARRYFGNRIFSFSSSGYLDVSVHRVPGLHLWIQYRPHEVCSCRFPHSDIHGSRVICTSPWLFAAYHVFHRLSVPRHPPYALCSLTNRFKLRQRKGSCENKLACFRAALFDVIREVQDTEGRLRRAEVTRTCLSVTQSRAI